MEIAVKNAAPTAVTGEKFVTGLKWKDVKTGAEETLSLEGIFVEIGLLPNTSWLKDSLVLNKIGQIVVDPLTQRAAISDDKGFPSRVWAAGDCTDGKYHQNNIAPSDPLNTLHDIYLFIKSS